MLALTLAGDSGNYPTYNVYVNGNKVATVEGDKGTYDVTGLASGVESTIEVEAVAGTKTAKSEAVKVKTAGVRVLDKGRHHITIEWDEVGKVYNGTAGGGNDFRAQGV